MTNNKSNVFFVSPEGSDDHSGTIEQPFRTLGKARDMIRTINQDMQENITVYLREGVYAASETLVFDHRDAGSNGCDIVYQAYPHEKAVISGGKRIDGWHRAAVQHRPDIWAAKVGEVRSRHLYVNGIQAVFSSSQKIFSKGWEILEDPDMQFHHLTETFSGPDGEYNVYEGYMTSPKYNHMSNWRNPSNIEFVYDVGWTRNILPVDSIQANDDGSGTVIKMKQSGFRDAQIKAGRRIGTPNYMQNVLELLENPGEWCMDYTEGIAYYIPRDGEDMETAECIMPVLEQLIVIRGDVHRPVEHLRFEHIGFMHTTYMRPHLVGHADIQANFAKHPDIDLHDTGFVKLPSCVVVDAGQFIAFERCLFHRLGNGGIDLQNGSRHNIIRGCRFADIAASAIQIGDVEHTDAHPDDEKTIVKNNTVTNNIVKNIGMEYKGSVGIFIGYAQDIAITHNVIADAPYSGISVGWGWGVFDEGGRPEPWADKLPRYHQPTISQNHLIANNHIFNVMQQHMDGGGIYTLSQMPGVLITDNLIHDTGEPASRDDSSLDGETDREAVKLQGWPGGIYLDEGSASIEATNNIVYNVPQCYYYNNNAGLPGKKVSNRVHHNFFRIRPGDPDFPRTIAEKAGLEPDYADVMQQP